MFITPYGVAARALVGGERPRPVLRRFAFAVRPHAACAAQRGHERRVPDVRASGARAAIAADLAVAPHRPVMRVTVEQADNRHGGTVRMGAAHDAGHLGEADDEFLAVEGRERAEHCHRRTPYAARRARPPMVNTWPPT